ncbi:MAG: TetR/AcrR family transcriptional regulator [Desulfobacteraceae bacterium]|nr:MAG: TetR/AcrR family transcriptional regulator [Desulfobacteraceae bacterium]
MGEIDTKNALVTSAIRMFQQNGFQRTRVSDIVSDAGVAQGTFYNYFRSKDDIFRDICTHFIDLLQQKFVERTEHLFDGETSDEVVENVRHVIRDIISIYQEHLDVAELLFREGIGNGGIFKEIYEDFLSLFLALIEDQVKKAIGRGLIQVEDSLIGSVLLFGLFERSLLYFVLIEQKTDMEKFERVLVDFVLKGLSFDYGFKAFKNE